MQTSIFGDKRRVGESHANRGMAFEAALNWQHAQYEVQKVAQVHKEYLPTLPVKDAKWAKVIGRATVDYVGQLAGGRFVAFDAKDCAGKRIELSRLAPHQLKHLEEIEALGGLAFVLVRFERREVYMVPVEAWKWAVEAHRAGHEVLAKRLGWTATGKASINVKELPAEWRVDGYDWAQTLRRYDHGRAAQAKED
jgi:recombination protein U